jgi:hypothetical protein
MLLRAIAVLGFTLPLLSASVINYTFTASINATSIGAYPIGTSLSGTIGFDNAATFYTSIVNQTEYTTNVGSILAKIGSQTYSTGTPFFETATQRVGVDEFTLVGPLTAAQLQAVAPGADYGELVLDFHYPTNALYSGGIVLPSSLPAGASITFALRALYQNPSGVFVQEDSASGPVRTFNQVPEPASLVLLGAGLAALAAWRRLESAR